VTREERRCLGGLAAPEREVRELEEDAASAPSSARRSW